MKDEMFFTIDISTVFICALPTISWCNKSQLYWLWHTPSHPDGHELWVMIERMRLGIPAAKMSFSSHGSFSIWTSVLHFV